VDDLYIVAKPIHGPEPPHRFSHSSLAELERCPRRWWLERATYTTGQGYPSIASAAALRGTVIHAALERFADHLGAAGFPPLGSSAFDDARTSFNVRSVVRALRDELLSRGVRRGAEVSADEVPLDECVAAFKRLLSRASNVSLDGETQSMLPVYRQERTAGVSVAVESTAGGGSG
jgi:PD-(D/E)XK nuclease superfamily